MITTGRLANGADFNVTTRDVNSGTLNVAASNVGLDASFAVGENDDNNGNAADGGTTKIRIGSGSLKDRGLKQPEQPSLTITVSDYFVKDIQLAPAASSVGFQLR